MGGVVGNHSESRQRQVAACREAGGDTPVEYWTIKLKQVFIDNISWGASSGGGKPTESVSISFAEIKFDYFSQDDKGAKKDDAKGGGW